MSKRKDQEKIAKRVSEAFKKNIIYIGVFLDDNSKQRLKNWWVEETGKELLDELYTHHMTLHFRPSPSEAEQYPVGKEVELNVIGYAEDEKGQAVLVDTPVRSQNENPHVTIATDGSTPPYYSNELLKEGVQRVSGGIVLKGRVGYWDGQKPRYE